MLGDTGATATNDLKMVFTDSTSFTWNGSGTLYLTGESTSTGTLTINSGKVIMDYAAWAGKVVVANGAELIVNENASAALVAAEVELEGKLSPNADMTIAKLWINRYQASGKATYGSTASGAKKVNDTNFGGTGKVNSLAKRGIVIFAK